MFYRGDDVIDRQKLGFLSDKPIAQGRVLFRYEAQCTGNPAVCEQEVNPANLHAANICVPGKWAGNSNRGHEGPGYGTDLPAGDKDAIVEYLKTF